MALQIGDQAPGFTLPDQDELSVSLSSFRGQKVVIYFYPKDDTPGCTKEACNFRDLWTAFESRNVKVLGISKDDAKSHLKFINKHHLPFALLTDLEPCPVATSYESYGLKKFMGREYMGIMRHAFIVNEVGQISMIYRKVKADKIAHQILMEIQS